MIEPVSPKNEEEIKRKKREHDPAHKKDRRLERQRYYATHKDKIKQYSETHKEEIRLRRRKFEATHKDEMKRRRQEYATLNKEKLRQYRVMNKERVRPRNRKAGQDLRKRFFGIYGNTCTCPCGCKESRIYFLTIGHPLNDGKADRDAKGRHWGVLRSAVDHPDHEKYAPICYNCNCAANANYGVCPGIKQESDSVRAPKPSD